MPNKDEYSAILGLKPSKGARSPKLWNKVYRHLKLKKKMIPIDIKKKNFKKKFLELSKDKNFIGGAVTVPYKEMAFKYLKGNYDKQVKRIKAINCLTRDKKNNLYGANTDGEAALISFKKKSNKKFNKIAILGYGGVGKAVTEYISWYFKKSKILVFIRKKKYKNYKNIFFLNWKKIDHYIDKFDALINCTSVGFLSNQSPLNKYQIKKLNKKLIFFDVIYQPKITTLMRELKKRGITSLNGLEMNLEQAVLAFKKTNKTNLSKKNIKKIMS